MPIDVESYLGRIAYSGPLTVSADALLALHRAHLRAVPFENLDIHLGRPIVLNEESFFNKIVLERRGGFCYELNGLFAALLRAIGFDVTLLSARVPDQSGGPGPEYDHLTLLVQLDGPWLADVGFGDSFLDPLRLEPWVDQWQDGVVYRLTTNGREWAMLKRLGDGQWTTGYLFTLQPRELSEFDGMCRYHQTSPKSHFLSGRICSLATASGRITLSDSRLVITENGHRTEQGISDEAEFAAKLGQHFGVTLPAGIGGVGSASPGL